MGAIVYGATGGEVRKYTKGANEGKELRKKSRR